jgi:hypothetical protein
VRQTVVTALLRLENAKMGRLIDKLIKDGGVVVQVVMDRKGLQGGQFLWKLKDGIVTCPSGHRVSLHDPDTFDYKVKVIEKAAQACGESSVCDPYCPLAGSDGLR